MSGSAIAECSFPAEPAAAGDARRAVRAALEDAGCGHLRDAAELVVSELVTNSLVHAGTHVGLRITAEACALRVEVHDGSPHPPVRRGWAHTAGTGRGLLIVEEYADRWGSLSTADGKVVWFEIGEPTDPLAVEGRTRSQERTVDVTLLDVPLLMQWAWQEHASSLMREFLLFQLEDDAEVMRQHAAASDALSLLNEQLPHPELPTDPDALMATLVEPDVTCQEVSLHLPVSSIAHFEVLDDLLARAVAAARRGQLLGAPTQPEIVEMRRWICGEVLRQARRLEPTSWRERPARAATRAGHDWAAVRTRLAGSDDALIATSDSSVIVAVTQAALDLLGYRDASQLVGRRVLVVIPERYHQAHITGTTLHVTNGRDALIGRWVTVPAVRADGSEVSVELRVDTDRHDGRSYFVAHLRVE